MRLPRRRHTRGWVITEPASGWSRDGAEDAPSGGERAPALVPGEAVRVRAVRTERRATAPPPRYSEAALVRRLEELGIGRP